MKLLRWFSLLLCACANAENNAVWRESGENVTLSCSSAGCSSSIEGYDGMYLYHNRPKRRQVLYYYLIGGATDKITPAPSFRDRIQTEGSLKNLTVTISKLTVKDSGCYNCVFVKFKGREVQCSIYTLFVRGAGQCSNSTEAPCALADEKSPPLVLIIVAACTIGTLVTIIFLLLVVPRVDCMSQQDDVQEGPSTTTDVLSYTDVSVRRRTSSSRSTTGVLQQVPNDNVYEVMTNNAAGLPASPHDCS